MKTAPLSPDWNSVDLVVFDLDGALYAQRRLRMIMSMKLLYSAAKSGSLDTLRVLRVFRNYREVLADSEPMDFVDRRYDETAFACDCSVANVKAIVSEWMEKRPLPYLKFCRLQGVAELFDALRRARKTIAVLSDDPAEAKLKALALQADIVVSATDDDVRCLTPGPRGLLKVLGEAGVRPTRAVMIGDSYERDVEAAYRVGMQSLLLARHKHDRCITFRSYGDDIFLPLVLSSRPRKPDRVFLTRRCE